MEEEWNQRNEYTQLDQDDVLGTFPHALRYVCLVIFRDTKTRDSGPVVPVTLNVKLSRPRNDANVIPRSRELLVPDLQTGFALEPRWHRWMWTRNIKASSMSDGRLEMRNFEHIHFDKVAVFTIEELKRIS